MHQHQGFYLQEIFVSLETGGLCKVRKNSQGLKYVVWKTFHWWERMMKKVWF